MIMALKGEQLEAAPHRLQLLLMALSESTEEAQSQGGGTDEDNGDGGALAQMVAYAAKLIEQQQQQQQQQQQHENEVPMVSMDGEAHPNMTLAAIGLGVLVALIILIILIAFITRRERSPHSKTSSTGKAIVPRLGVAEPRDHRHPIPTISQRLATHAPSVTRCVTFANDYELQDVVTTRM
ncbi:uncharacterized protein LOC125949966 [Anopheles darlingi]|uniref:uncharacterized protein LOC125949966 n=1 Tax=Anopheles darlingi TaxID=43151 RepID=UPI0021002310|nr:uncharacterized protein LOC125949966 [Anopheles darlingi]